VGNIHEKDQQDAQVCILLIFLTYTYHNAWFRECTNEWVTLILYERSTHRCIKHPMTRRIF